MQISRAEPLVYFEQDSKMHIVVDAGLSGLSTVLVQLQGDSGRVIAYALPNITNLLRGCIVRLEKKEAVATVRACERFNLYVFG